MTNYLILATRPGAIVQIVDVVSFDNQQTITDQLNAWRTANPGYEHVDLLAVTIAGQADAPA